MGEIFDAYSYIAVDQDGVVYLVGDRVERYADNALAAFEKMIAADSEYQERRGRRKSRAPWRR